MRRLSSTDREKLYDAEALKAREAGRGNYPICNLCCLPVTPGQSWDESHEKLKPRWLGGEVEGLAHRRCNRLWNNQHDTPLFHRTKRQRRAYIGARVPRSIMPGSRADWRKVKINGDVVLRSTGEPLRRKPWVRRI